MRNRIKSPDTRETARSAVELVCLHACSRPASLSLLLSLFVFLCSLCVYPFPCVLAAALCVRLWCCNMRSSKRSPSSQHAAHTSTHVTRRRGQEGGKAGGEGSGDTTATNTLDKRKVRHAARGGAALSAAARSPAPRCALHALCSPLRTLVATPVCRWCCRMQRGSRRPRACSARPPHAGQKKTGDRSEDAASIAAKGTATAAAQRVASSVLIRSGRTEWKSVAFSIDFYMHHSE